MTAPALRIEAPSDAQLRYIASLCTEYGWQPPEAVFSKVEASAIIAAMKDGSYRAAEYGYTAASPTHDGADYGGSDVDYYSTADAPGVPF